MRSQNEKKLHNDADQIESVANYVEEPNGKEDELVHLILLGLPVCLWNLVSESLVLRVTSEMR